MYHKHGKFKLCSFEAIRLHQITGKRLEIYQICRFVARVGKFFIVDMRAQPA